jgi:hypothetical protein
MTQGVKDLIDAIASGDSLAIDAAFNSEMATRISERLDGMRADVAQNMFATESVQELDELSKKTLGSYVKKASNDLASSIHGERDAEQDDEHDAQEYHGKRAEKRMSGLERAGNKIAK